MKFLEYTFSVAKLLVINPMTSASASLMRKEIFTTTNYISFKPVIPNIQLYKMTMTRKAAETTSAVKTIKATAATTMALMNRQKRNKSLGGGGDSSVDSDMEEVVPLNGRRFNKIFQIVPRQSFQDRIIELEAINNPRDAFAAMLSNPKKLMEGRFEQLELNGRPVQGVPHPTVAKVSEIEDAL